MRPATVPTLLVAAAHLTIACLDGAGRSAFQYPPHESLLTALGDWDGWVALHTCVTIAIVASLAVQRPGLTAIACRVSVGILGLWSTLALAWAITSPVPVSMIGSTFGLLLTGVGLWCSTQWTYATPRRHRG